MSKRKMNKKLRHFRSDKLSYDDLYKEVQRLAKEMPPPKGKKSVSPQMEEVPKSDIKKVPLYKKAGSYLKKGTKFAIRGGKSGLNYTKKGIKDVRNYPSRLDEKAKRELEEYEERTGPLGPIYIDEEDFYGYDTPIRKPKKKKTKRTKKPKKINPFDVIETADKFQKRDAKKMERAKKEYDKIAESAYNEEYY